jgi:phosphatidylserine/phosphatidylglycerophosphate/cardiolipin synthase-like enzyme
MAETDFSNWFLTEAEIRDARGGVTLPRTLAVMSSGNLVTPLVDGEAYIRSLIDDVKRTSGERDDFLHLTAWRLDWELDLDPPAASGAPANLTTGMLLSAAIERGVASRTLLWSSPGGKEGENNTRSTRELRRLTANARRGGAIWDDRLPSVLASFHQKTAAIRREDELVAYCGGIDLAADRWDTPDHDGGGGRRRKEAHAGWHDVQARLRGPAALDVWNNFRDRWNDPLVAPLLLPPLPFRHRPPPRIDATPPPVATMPGTHHVQHWRTLACRGNRYPSFAPMGELTCLAGYLKAIRGAKKYIYIEDQYLYWDVIARELAIAVKRIERLVILVPPATDIPDPFTKVTNYKQHEFTEILRQADPDGVKVGIYHPVQRGTGEPGTPIYVHSKLLIVDDILAVIGSPNIGRRSMTHDAEIATAVIDATVEHGECVFAHDLRRRLWGEHLGLKMDDPALADPIKAADLWRDQARGGHLRVRLHTEANQQPRRDGAFLWTLVAPDGRCPTRIPKETVGNRF